MFEKISKSICLQLNEVHFSFMKNSWREIEDTFVFLSIPYCNSSATYPCQRAWWTQMKSPDWTKFCLQMSSYFIPALTAFIVWPTTLWSEVSSPQQYPLIIDQWCMFYLKLKKYWLKLAAYVWCQGINNWAGLFYSLSSCLLKGAWTFCCCHLAMVISQFTSAACKQQYCEQFNEWQFH